MRKLDSFAGRVRNRAKSWMIRVRVLGLAGVVGFVSLGPTGVAAGALEVVRPAAPVAVFGGSERAIEIAIKNSGDQPVETQLRFRMFQASAHTAMPAGEVQAGKRVATLPGQTVLETLVIRFPTVRARTRHVVRWLDPEDRSLGVMEVDVYPTNLLAELVALADPQPVGTYDPAGQLRPLLESLKVPFRDLRNAALESFPGHLVVLGPFTAQRPASDTLIEEARALAKRGGHVLLFQSQNVSDTTSRAPISWTPLGRGALVVARASLVQNLGQDPLAQLQLIELARLAVRGRSAPTEELTP